MQFRKAFKFQGGADLLHWFPMHMQHGLKKIQAKMKTVDAIIEVHDARIPFSGRSSLLTENTKLRPHLLILNKEDLADVSRREEIEGRLLEGGVSDVMWASCHRPHSPSLKQIIPRLVDMVNQSHRYHREYSTTYSVMVVGVPNTGKSTLINSLRKKMTGVKGDAVRVGDKPGVTKTLHNRVRISHRPEIFLVDTPGIYEPRVLNIESGMRLAMCNVLSDVRLGYEHLADYALYWMNKEGRTAPYVNKLALNGPVDDVKELMFIVAAMNEWTQVVNDLKYGAREVLDVERVAKDVVRRFRAGEFGQIMLDTDYLSPSSSSSSSTPSPTNKLLYSSR